MKRSISQVSDRSLKSRVFLYPMTTKYSHGHDKVCANIIQLKKIKVIIFFLVWFLIINILVFIIFCLLHPTLTVKYIRA